MAMQIGKGQGSARVLKTRDSRIMKIPFHTPYSLPAVFSRERQGKTESAKHAVQKYVCLPNDVSSCEIILGVPGEKIVPRMVGNSHVVLVCFAGKQLPLTGGLPHPLG